MGEYEIYSVKNYSLLESKWDTVRKDFKNLKNVCESIETNDYFHLRLVKGENYILYIDLDGYKYKIDRFFEEFKNFMDCKYKLTINDDDISYTENTGKKGSYHISIPSIYASTEKQSEIIKNLKNFVNEETKKNLDSSVYCNKWFRLPNQTKGYNKRKPDADVSPHIIKTGKIEDFILNYIPMYSKCINDVTYILNETQQKKNDKVDEKQKDKKERDKKSEELIKKSYADGKNPDVEQIEQLLNILDVKTMEYETWRNIGFILKKYELNTGHKMLDVFDSFSKRSEKYDRKGLLELWEYLKTYDLKINIGTLFFLAKQENLNSYKEITRLHHKKTFIDITEKYLSKKIKELAGQYFFYKDGTLYSYDINLKFWYEEHTQILKKYINDQLFDHVSHYINDAIDDYDYHKKQTITLRFLCLSDAGQEKVIKTFYNRYFNEIIDDVEFDTKFELLGFSNGVYDLKKNEFRQYKYNDYMTTQTGYKYHEAKEEDIKVIEKIMNQIENKETHLKLLYQILGTGLIGKSYQKLIIENGAGGNGKSFLSKMKSFTLGNYYYKGDIKSLCEKKSSGASPELAQMHNKRQIEFSEPESTDKIKNGRMKEITGDQSIIGRLLFSNRTCVKMVGTITIQCNVRIYLENDATDAEIRRIIDYLFMSRFVEDEELVDEENRIYLGNRKYMEDEFCSKYKFAFLHLLIKSAHAFLTTENETFLIPPDIKKRTDEYIGNSFLLLNILKETTEKTNDKNDCVQISDLYDKVRLSDMWTNSSKEERRKINKKYMINFYETNKYTSVNYKERYRPHIDGKQQEQRNVLIGYKLINDSPDN